MREEADSGIIMDVDKSEIKKGGKKEEEKTDGDESVVKQRVFKLTEDGDAGGLEELHEKGGRPDVEMEVDRDMPSSEIKSDFDQLVATFRTSQERTKSIEERALKDVRSAEAKNSAKKRAEKEAPNRALPTKKAIEPARHITLPPPCATNSTSITTAGQKVVDKEAFDQLVATFRTSQERTKSIEERALQHIKSAEAKNRAKKMVNTKNTTFTTGSNGQVMTVAKKAAQECGELLVEVT